MAHRRRRQRRGGSPAFVFLIFAAVIAGALLYPLTHKQRAHVAQLPRPAVTRAAPLPSPERTEAPAAGATPGAARTPAPAAISPSPEVQTAPAAHRLAIIIDDCGQWPKTERALIALPVPITLSVMPQERYTHVIAQEAAAAGKGVMLHLPMEPQANIDPGRGKITTAMSDDAIAAQTAADVAAVPLAKGVNNHEGSKATSDERVMTAVARALAPSGLFFIDSRTSAQSVAQAAASAAGMRTAARDVFLDNVDSVDAVERQLDEAAGDAQRNGSAIAIGHPREATLAALSAMIPALQRRGITFVLASDLVR